MKLLLVFCCVVIGCGVFTRITLGYVRPCSKKRMKTMNEFINSNMVIDGKKSIVHGDLKDVYTSTLAKLCFCMMFAPSYYVLFITKKMGKKYTKVIYRLGEEQEYQNMRTFIYESKDNIDRIAKSIADIEIDIVMKQVLAQLQSKSKEEEA